VGRPVLRTVGPACRGDGAGGWSIDESEAKTRTKRAQVVQQDKGRPARSALLFGCNAKGSL